MNRKRRPRAGKTRTKAKKPKFLSLRLQFPAEEAVKTRRIGETRAAAESVEVFITTSPAADSESHGLNLFPLHPGNQLQDREIAQYQENVAYFFSATDGGATSLTGILDDSADNPSISSHTTNNNSNRYVLACVLA